MPKSGSFQEDGLDHMKDERKVQRLAITRIEIHAFVSTVPLHGAAILLLACYTLASITSPISLSYTPVLMFYDLYQAPARNVKHKLELSTESSNT